MTNKNRAEALCSQLHTYTIFVRNPLMKLTLQEYHLKNKNDSLRQLKIKYHANRKKPS